MVERQTLTAEVLFQYATTTGEFYNKYCDMARRNVDFVYWTAHVRDAVIPGYELDFHCKMANIGFDRERIIVDAASDLRAYYINHIKETKGS